MRRQNRPHAFPSIPHSNPAAAIGDWQPRRCSSSRKCFSLFQNADDPRVWRGLVPLRHGQKNDRVLEFSVVVLRRSLDYLDCWLFLGWHSARSNFYIALIVRQFKYRWYSIKQTSTSILWWLMCRCLEAGYGRMLIDRVMLASSSICSPSASSQITMVYYTHIIYTQNLLDI